MPDEPRQLSVTIDTSGDPPELPAAADPEPLDDMPVPPLTDEDETKGG